MKAKLFFLASSLIIINALPAFSQCAGGSIAQAIVYDTVVVGTGNNSYAFSIPKFDPSLGTFLSVNFQSNVNLSYSYTLQNHDAVPVTFKTRTLRDDDILAAEFDGADISQSHQTNQIINTVAANQSLVYGPAHFGYIVKDSVTNGSLINFEGTGNVNYDYEQSTGYNLSTTGGTGNVNINFNYVHDTTQFMVIYKYCPNVLLSADLLFFTADQKTKSSAWLSWRQATLRQDRTYEVQVSTNGMNFSPVALVEENATGIYNYNYQNHSARKAFFRIQEKTATGETRYSNTRQVTFDPGAKAVSVFPTLYTGGSLHINFPEPANWQVSVYAADGHKMLETHSVNVNNTSLPLPAGLANGCYFVELLNRRSQQREMTRIIVQR